MTLTPSAIDVISFFYPTGNTPASCSTQELPSEENASVLFLGCGDVRNVLFTTYCEQNYTRKLDFTCCDYEAAIIARNILFYTFVLDDEVSLESLWNIYYHFFLNEKDLVILSNQADKLLTISESLHGWHSSKYSQILRFVDEETMQNVRYIWKSYSVLSMGDTQRSHLAGRLQEQINWAKSAAEVSRGKSMNITGLRATAPVWIQAFADVTDYHEHFWKYGVSSKEEHVLSSAILANPTFTPPFSYVSKLHYGINPLLGFHLSTTYAPQTKDSPLHRGKSTRTGFDKLVANAQMQLGAWTKAFRQVQSRISISFLAKDALQACYLWRNSHLGDKPTTFNIIDTSNLSDHVGLFNLLISVCPLLSRSPNSMLYTELLVKQSDSLRQTVSDILFGDLATIAFLLGVHPVEYWNNNTMISPEDANHDALRAKALHGQNSSGQVHCRLPWKKKPIGSRTLECGILMFPADSLARLLYQVYLNMFSHENVSKSFARLLNGDGMPVVKSSIIHYHRGSFAALLSYVKSCVFTNWSNVVDKVITLVETDSELLVGRNYIQEFYLFLHLYGVFTTKPLNNPSIVLDGKTDSSFLRQWNELPPVLCVTIKVPRSNLKIFTEGNEAPKTAPFVHGIVQSSSPDPRRGWQNLFSATRMVFGTLHTQGHRGTNDFALSIDVDKSRWEGNQPLIVSFLVPAWIFLLDENAIVSFGLQSTPHCSHTFMNKLGVELEIFRSHVNDSGYVFLTKDPPKVSLSNDPCFQCTSISSFGPTLASSPERPTILTAEMDENLRLTKVRARLNLQEEPCSKILENKAVIDTKQHGNFEIIVKISRHPQTYEYRIHFPLPICLSKSSTRVARASKYVEIMAAISAEDDFSKPDYQRFESFVYEGRPAMNHVPRVQIDLMPTLNHQLQQDLQWLITHLSMQMSSREREIREKFLKSPHNCPDEVVNFKDSLFSLFMHFTGLQGKAANVFGLTVRNGGGIHILIFVSKLKLDVGNQTCFLDAAVVPLTPAIVHELGRFLSSLSSQRLCQVAVEPDELKIWHQMLPVYVERCRRWAHTDDCEYLAQGRIPLSFDKGASPVCSCGKGKLPNDFIRIPGWNIAKPFAYRAAIAPLFSVPYIESPNVGKLEDGESCCQCRGVSNKLLLCANCRSVKYCSKECQKKDWKWHKATCKSVPYIG